MIIPIVSEREKRVEMWWPSEHFERFFVSLINHKTMEEEEIVSLLKSLGFFFWDGTDNGTCNLEEEMLLKRTVRTLQLRAPLVMLKGNWKGNLKKMLALSASLSSGLLLTWPNYWSRRWWWPNDGLLLFALACWLLNRRPCLKRPYKIWRNCPSSNVTFSAWITVETNHRQLVKLQLPKHRTRHMCQCRRLPLGTQWWM